MGSIEELIVEATSTMNDSLFEENLMFESIYLDNNEKTKIISPTEQTPPPSRPETPTKKGINMNQSY